MAGVNFTHDAAMRIANAVRRVERTPQSMTGDANPAQQPGTSFWAYLVSCDLSGQFWSWLKLVPARELPVAGYPFTTEDQPLFDLESPAVFSEHTAREANGNKAIPPGAVVLLNFIGYDRDGGPVYVFSYNPPRPQPDLLPIHDHRDNYNGGFAFAVYAPGTRLPQQAWHD